MINIIKKYIILFFAGILFINEIPAQEATLKVSINHFANGKKLKLNESIYFTSLGEPYQVKRLKYYISRSRFKENLLDSAFLIDASGNNNFEINIKPDTYSQFIFTLGIDSLLQSTGAQTDALDVM